MGKILRDDLQTTNSITEERMEAFETILDTIKKKAEEAKIFTNCLFAWDAEVCEGAPIIIDDSGR